MADVEWNIAYDRYCKDFAPYYDSLEREFCQTLGFVELDPANGKAFSLTYSKLLQAVCAEVEVFAQAFAALTGSSFKMDGGIKVWGAVLSNACPKLCGRLVAVPGYGEIAPWAKMGYDLRMNKRGEVSGVLASGCKTPAWWLAYNRVKNERSTLSENGASHFGDANQKNVLFSLAALFTLEQEFLDTCAQHRCKVDPVRRASGLFAPAKS